MIDPDDFVDVPHYESKPLQRWADGRALDQEWQWASLWNFHAPLRYNTKDVVIAATAWADL